MPNARMLTQQALCQLLRLTPREAEVLCWVTQGKRNDEIGLILGTSPATVKKHLEHIHEKLGVQTHMAVAVLRVLPCLGIGADSNPVMGPYRKPSMARVEASPEG